MQAEREADESQRATALEEAERDMALIAVRSKVAGKAPAGFNKKDCTECALPIAAGRLALGKWTCIYCQEILDEDEKRKARR